MLPAVLLLHPMEAVVADHPTAIHHQPGPIIRRCPKVIISSALNFQVPLKLCHKVVTKITIQIRPVSTSGMVVNLGNSSANVGLSSSDLAFGLVQIPETTNTLPELGLEACSFLCSFLFASRIACRKVLCFGSLDCCLKASLEASRDCWVRLRS